MTAAGAAVLGCGRSPRWELTRRRRARGEKMGYNYNASSLRSLRLCVRFSRLLRCRSEAAAVSHGVYPRGLPGARGAGPDRDDAAVSHGVYPRGLLRLSVDRQTTGINPMARRAGTRAAPRNLSRAACDAGVRKKMSKSPPKSPRTDARNDKTPSGRAAACLPTAPAGPRDAVTQSVPGAYRAATASLSRGIGHWGRPEAPVLLWGAFSGFLPRIPVSTLTGTRVPVILSVSSWRNARSERAFRRTTGR
jgi:hypothetical protein